MEPGVSGVSVVGPGRMRMVRVLSVRRESPVHFTVEYADDVPAEPGQFVMVWVPGVDEIPMGLSVIEDSGDVKKRGFTVHVVGEATRALASLGEGDLIGVKGPLGRGFSLPPDVTSGGLKVLLVGGGTGVAPLVPLAERIKKGGGEVVFLQGSSSAELLLFRDRLSHLGEVAVATDDGSEGYHGVVTDLLGDVFERFRPDAIYTCGPEVMMKKVVDFAVGRGVFCEASLERFMKCGVGVCDSCSVGGYRVCADGPVFPASLLVSLEEFGRWRRDETGRRVPLA